ncbi:MAG: DUF2252 domain-containing protein [Planctomycetales bacterium]|nr:DUF2252 domain-containing protein [Planctomycetales bacterium]
MAKKTSAPTASATELTVPPPEKSAAARDLAGLREFWQTTAPYDPLRPLDSRETRYELGKALREQTPRESHAAWTPVADRADPVATVLASNVGREESLVPLRMARMAESPLAFLRGACAVMAGDLAQTPVSGPQVVIDGDAHINNFGLYGTPQRDVVIDINDFDEATIGPWEWDLKRLVASVNVAGRENGLDAEERRAAVMRCVGGYSLNAQRLMKLGILETWSLFAYAELERNEAVLKSVRIQIGNKFRAVVKKVLAKAQRTHNDTLLEKVARRQADGGWRFVEDPPILTSLDEDTRQKVIASLTEYAETLPPEYRIMLHRYSVADVCHRVVGVGSVGTRAYLVLLFGNGDDDPLFLQVKEAVAPAHAPYLPPLPVRVTHEGFRIIKTQRLLQSLGDPLLGYTTIDGRHYFVRQMKNLKASMPIEFLTGEPFEFWGWICGMLLARAHARTGDIAKIAGYIGKSDAFATALADFAEAYGDQTERDHAALVEAVRTGRVETLANSDL